MRRSPKATALRRAPWCAALILIGLAIENAPPAAAACHAFNISVSPARVNEGGSVTYTVSRDANVNPSSIEVTSVDGTAAAPSDYPKVSHRVDFTTDESQTFQLKTVDDAVAEGDETFKLHLSNPQGCPVNTQYVVGSDATVTIASSDTASTTSTTARSATTIRSSTTTQRGTTTTTGAVVSTTGPTVLIDENAATTSTTEGDGDDEDDSSPVAAIALGIGILAVLALLGYLIWRRRQTAP